MKKALKITGIVLAFLIALVILFLSLPWVFTSSYVKKKFPNLKTKMSSRPRITAEVPDDWLTLSTDRVSLSAPAEFATDKKGFVLFRSEGEFVAAVLQSDPDVDKEYQPKAQPLLDACTRSFYKKIGCDPDTMTEYDEINVARNLDISQYRGTSWLSAGGFLYLAYENDISNSLENLYYYDWEGVDCYFVEYHTKRFKYSYGLFVPGDNGFTVIVNGNDLDMVEKCFASIKISEELK